MKETKQKKKTTKQSNKVSNNALNKKLNKKPNNEEFVMQPKVDYCFKELMKDPYIRKGFLSAILSIPAEEIKETTLLPTEYNRQSDDDKLIILDVRVLLNSKEQLDIEMQVGYQAFWKARSTYYLSKMYAEQLKPGDEYDKLEKCIHISILNFTLFSKEDNFYSRFHLREDSKNFLYTDKLELHVIELPKVKKNIYPDNDILQWSNFFNVENREELDAMMNKNEYIDKACETIVTLSADEKKRIEYEQRLKSIRDHDTQMSYNYNKGLEDGIKEGIEKGIKEGESKLMKLIQLLIQDNRTEDIARVTSDETYKEELYSKYDLY